MVMLPWDSSLLEHLIVIDFYGLFARTSMEHDEDTVFLGHGSKFMGAIFMSNRATKKECFKRKVFGLPASQAGFVKKVKVGMFLFLFEHEKRKLYGVFEAKSDGAMNVMPNAFLQSGMTFPAQVHFKTLWMCRPLSEDEFSGAIEENYFMPHKFNFGLSHKQVHKLIQLFSSKRISPQRYLSSGVHVKVNRKFENSSLGNTRVTGRASSVRFDTTEHYTESDIDSSRNSALCGLNINHSMCYENADLTSEDHVVGTQHRFYPTDPSALKPQLPIWIPSTSQIDHALRGSFLVSPGELPYYHNLPSFEGTQPSHALGMNEPTLARKLTDAQALHFRSHSYSSQPDPETFNLPSTDYQSLDVSSFHKDLPVRVCEPFREKGYANFQERSQMSFPKCYDSSTSNICSAEGTDSLNSVLSLSNARGHPTPTQQEDSARGRRYWSRPYHSDFTLSEDENLARNLEPSQFLSSYSSEPREDNEYKGMGAYYFSQSNEYYPTAASSILHSDAVQGRSSVFSRLSRAPGAWKQKTNPSLDQLLGLLSQRRKQWNKMPRLAMQSITRNYDDDGDNYNDDEQLESIVEMEPNGADSVVELKPRSEVMVEGRVELPFLNFKRRSEAQKVEVETDGGVSVEGGEGKYKRKKLVRPSFTEVDHFIPGNWECRNAQSSEDSGIKNTLFHEANLGSVELMNLKNNVEGPRDCRSEGTGTVEMLTQLPTADETVLNSEDTGKDVAISVGNAETFKVESGINRAKATTEKLEAESEERFHLAGDERFALPVQGKFEGNKSDDVCEKNETLSDGNKYTSCLEANVGNVELMDEGSRDCKSEGTVIVDRSTQTDESILNSEDNGKDATISDGSADSFSVESDIDHASESDGKLEDENSEKKFHVVGDENVSLPAQGECEGKKCDEDGKKNETFSHVNTEKNPLESNIHSAQVSTVNNEAGGMEEHHMLLTGNVKLKEKAEYGTHEFVDKYFETREVGESDNPAVDD